MLIKKLDRIAAYRRFWERKLDILAGYLEKTSKGSPWTETGKSRSKKMSEHHDKRFPGESDDYRTARDSLLTAELALRRQIEAVAAQRRALPPGGPLKEDYVFTALSGGGAASQVRFSELFEAGKESLFLYSFMFAPGDETPCPACTSLLDGLNGSAPHIRARINFAVVGKAPLPRLLDWAEGRGWNNLRLLSSEDNSYNADYFGETGDGGQIPAINIFHKGADGIRHRYNSELLYAPWEDGQHGRHADMLWPIWNAFDMTPEGRGSDWFPRFSYS